ncbi:pentatricopeptide repeat-containing protein At3g51320-like [Arachis stenosperma]|uniref:pentatricopeptide repeat-containing protein At3g51320-like n=1 Tax=Arachis stenosperma TaxID=217475 RepID=UPI0025ABE1F3|nr:pentatricopeptide repeat-containing protein At3g51320-like [Arachis stenosperma]XP_057756743.1 pentatricopeptide repeat-containing protein At3g51320-like [Arachis stenosperma]XP_057756744.1 pentatricopeptide repeat-containing protein At3g51320-like [Arachis stenosperma]XP_057756745.1 pentatricopeptide repeat-containing protein At3g51320-like [Arachis stenosperma]
MARISKEAMGPVGKRLSEVLVCSLSKHPLRYYQETNSLISNAIPVSFPIKNGIPCLVPQDGKILEEEDGKDTTTTTLSPFNAFHAILQSACHTTRHLLQIQALLTTTALLRNPHIARTLLSRASHLCDVAYTLLIFHHFNNTLDTFCVNTMIQAYSNSHVPHQALAFLFNSLQSGFFPNSYTFVPLIGSCAKMGCLQSGRKCHSQALKNGVDGVLPVQNSLIHMYGCCGDVGVARVVFDTMLSRDLVSWNSIIDGYVTVGELNAAYALFDEMPERNLITWNVMIAGHLKARNPGFALKLFREMGRLGLKGNARTMVSVITACGRSARLKEGRSVHASIIRTLARLSLIIDTALIDMYCKCKRVDVAHVVFERMANRNLVSWNAMILGHCIRGNPEDGLNLFDLMVGMEKMKHEVELDKIISADRSLARLSPDEVTFIGILCACARAEKLTAGRFYFKQMTDVFNVKPNFAHFWCMANLLANVGLVDEAEEFLRNIIKFDGDMSYESLLWANLLGFCHFKRDVDLGERIAKLMIDLDPKNLACYQFLLVIYVVADQRENVSMVKKLAKDRLGVIPGSTLVDLKNIVHNFKVSNRWREGFEAVNKMMDELAHRLGLEIFESGQPLVDRRENIS